MEPSKTYKPTSEAFSRYFAGESQSEEVSQIKQWASSNPDHMEELDLLQTIWQDVGSIEIQPVSVNVESAFQKVKAKKEAHEKTSPSFWNVWKVAAVLVLVASALWMFLNKKTEVPTTKFVADAIETINLPDGSEITINAGGVLTYPEVFDDKRRKVSLSGEAFFQVAHNPEQPFVVEVHGVNVTVLGTSFNIKETEETINVSVATGRVEVKSAHGTEILTAGDQVTVDLKQNEMTLAENSASGTEQYWFSKKLTFEGVRLASVISDLEEAYGVTIEVANDRILNCRLQATFEEQSIEEVMEIISISQELTVDGANGTYLLTGKGCDD